MIQQTNPNTQKITQSISTSISSKLTNFIFQGINNIQSTYNNTFITCLSKYSTQQILSHIDKNGKQLNYIKFNSYFHPQFKILNEIYVIILIKKQLKDYLVVWDIQKYITYQLQLQQIYTSTVKILIFNQSNIICLIQSLLKQKQIHINQYKFIYNPNTNNTNNNPNTNTNTNINNNQHKQNRIQHINNHKYNNINYNNSQIIKINQYSKIALINKQYQTNQLKIYTYQLQNKLLHQNFSQMQQENNNNNLGIQNQLCFVYPCNYEKSQKIKILNIWQIYQDNLYIQINIQSNSNKLHIQNFLFNTNTNTITPYKLNPTSPHHNLQNLHNQLHIIQFINNINYKSLKQINKIQHLYKSNNKLIIYYVELSTGYIVAQLEINGEYINNVVMYQNRVMEYQFDVGKNMMRIDIWQYPQYWINSTIITVFLLQNLYNTSITNTNNNTNVEMSLDEDLLHAITILTSQNNIQFNKLIKFNNLTV